MPISRHTFSSCLSLEPTPPGNRTASFKFQLFPPKLLVSIQGENIKVTQAVIDSMGVRQLWDKIAANASEKCIIYSQFLSGSS